MTDDAHEAERTTERTENFHRGHRESELRSWIPLWLRILPRPGRNIGGLGCVPLYKEGNDAGL
jgi:hypothetical protein